MSSINRTSRRALLAGAPAAALTAGAAANGAVLGIARAAGADPVTSDPALKAIREHRAAREELRAACEANDLDMEECPRKWAAECRQMDAELALFSTRPTTLYGIAALLLYVTTASDDGGDDETIYEYARGWQNLPELEDAVANFHQRVAGAFRNIIARGAA
jgi:hypothetical protein